MAGASETHRNKKRSFQVVVAVVYGVVGFILGGVAASMLASFNIELLVITGLVVEMPIYIWQGTDVICEIMRVAQCGFILAGAILGAIVSFNEVSKKPIKYPFYVKYVIAFVKVPAWPGDTLPAKEGSTTYLVGWAKD